MQKELYDVVMVGAGIVGCSVAYHLAKSGLAELIQRHATPFGLDLKAFDPDRSGGWTTSSFASSTGRVDRSQSASFPNG